MNVIGAMIGFVMVIGFYLGMLGVVLFGLNYLFS